MSRYTIGPVSVWVTPAALMKAAFAAVPWVLHGTDQERQTFERYRTALLPALVALPNDCTRTEFIEAGLDAVQAVETQQPDLTRAAGRFGAQMVLRLLDEQRWALAVQRSTVYSDWMARWVYGPHGALARAAFDQYAAWGVTPLRDVFAAHESYGTYTSGTYLTALRTICVQFDVVCRAPQPELQLIETILHEQLHAALHHQLGDDPERRELIWLEELAAVLTSHHALFTAARKTGDMALMNRVASALRHRRTIVEYGDLASAFLRDTYDALLPWRAWQAICALPADDRRNYAAESVIRPLLHRLGWRVSFPYEYGDYSVTCYTHRK